MACLQYQLFIARREYRRFANAGRNQYGLDRRKYYRELCSELHAQIKTASNKDAVADADGK